MNVTSVEAALVIADHAPAALLAARTLGLPAATLDSGFSVPPPETPFPSLRPWLAVPQETANAVLERLRLPAAIGAQGFVRPGRPFSPDLP